jgi:HEAT repeat protein
MRYSFGSSSTRRVRPLNNRCETFLAPAERVGLVKQVAAISRDPDPQIRKEVAVTLGRIGSPAAINLLRAMLTDPHHPKGERVCITEDDKPEVCRDSWPVRDAAREALNSISRLRRP